MKPEDVKVCVIRIEGTNCEDEMAGAFEAVGAQAEKVHLKQLISRLPLDFSAAWRTTMSSRSPEASPQATTSVLEPSLRPG